MTAAPLDGVLVVDLSRYLPGPFASQMLHLLGARIVKVEEPEMGDPVRGAPPFRSGRSVLAEMLLSGVESVALDFRKEGALEVLHSLLSRADVLLESFRPGALAAIGLEPGELRRQYPRLLGCSISGWGQSGPRAARAGHDLSYQAAAGTLASTGRMPNLPSADLLGAWSAVAAISATLFSRERSGRGAWIDSSLFDAAVIGNLTNVAAGSEGDQPPGSTGPLTGAFPCYRLYRTREGRLFAVAALEPKFWRGFCEEVERPDLLRAQYRRDPESHRKVAAILATRTGAEWTELFRALDLPGELVLTPEEALGGQHSVARGLEAMREGRLAFPARADGSETAGASGFPRLGQHTRAILAEFCPARLRGTRRSRLEAGIGTRVSLRRSLKRFVTSLRD
jgi:crotonobetainyl-CoA:carnitine CoA-transferase CaiB-like acyl-CoA transferase